MTISKYPSKVYLPQENHGWTTVLDYLIDKFQGIDKAIWHQRILDDKVHWQDGTFIKLDTPYRPQAAVFYYREVKKEPVIPFEHNLIYQNEHILIADKPHFLPVNESGAFVNECLQNRLRKETGIDELQALHRLDRETAGLVMFSINSQTRAYYHALFANKTITKTYQAIAKTPNNIQLIGKQWEINNRMIKSDPSFVMSIDKQASSKDYNAHSKIRCIKQSEHLSLFELQPITGKTHQLRVHMQSIGYPILNDKFYPTLLPKSEDNFDQPLQLLAQSLDFKDPVTQQQHSFQSKLMLSIEEHI
ncbi:MAG: pseudouridine synthase [Kangiellaceae bacterium]|nr:pseudouridine synthase [Kangiellaceae bacterium]